MRPQNIQNFHFFVESPRSRRRLERTLDRFLIFLRADYPTLAFRIWHDSLYRLRSYCCETARRSIRPIFSVHPVGKTMRWIKNDWHLFDDLDELYHHVKFVEDRTTRAGCRFEKMVFVCFLFVCHAPSLAPCSFEGGIFWRSIVSWFMGRFWYCLHHFWALIALSYAPGSSYWSYCCC